MQRRVLIRNMGVSLRIGLSLLAFFIALRDNKKELRQALHPSRVGPGNLVSRTNNINEKSALPQLLF